MTILGRQQQFQQKILYERGLRSAVVMSLFVGCGGQDKGNGHFSPSTYNPSFQQLNAACSFCTGLRLSAFPLLWQFLLFLLKHPQHSAAAWIS